MYCPNCGEPREKGVMFCPYCGFQMEKEPEFRHVDEKDRQIQGLQVQIAQLQQQASQGGQIGHLEQQIADLQRQLRIASQDVRKARQNQSCCWSCVICFIILAIVGFLMTYITLYL